MGETPTRRAGGTPATQRLRGSAGPDQTGQSGTERDNLGQSGTELGRTGQASKIVKHCKYSSYEKLRPDNLSSAQACLPRCHFPHAERLAALERTFLPYPLAAHGGIVEPALANCVEKPFEGGDPSLKSLAMVKVVRTAQLGIAFFQLVLEG